DSNGNVINTANCFQSVAANTYVVIGDPDGSLSDDVFLELRNPTGALIDKVEIGGNTDSSDYGGNGAGNGAPAGSDGNALGLYDEAVARVPNGVDTGNDLVDWKKQRATLGRSNTLTPGPDTTPPTVALAVVTRRLTNGTARVDTDLSVTFSEPMDLATI